MLKRLAILGSTGSIGTQTLNVVRRHPDRFSVEVLCAGSNVDGLIAQAREFVPNAVAIADESQYERLSNALDDLDIKVFAGEDAVADLMTMSTIDIVVAAIVGFAGLKPTLAAIRSGHPIALANKETMVVAGAIVTAEAARYKVPILPVDSEHSAIFQCLVGECGQWNEKNESFISSVDKIILTASGGPFRGRKVSDLQNVTLQQALNHPNWSMGRKVTIDSASLMNKGLEVIEARWLFNVSASNIKVVVHPQSVIHSMVQFVDGSVKAQLGVPTMETPIQFALSYPERIESYIPRLNFLDYPSLTFEEPDVDTFRCLSVAYSAIERGGNMPCAMNAANEVAVQEFINGKISFLAIADRVEQLMTTVSFVQNPSLDDLFNTHSSIMQQI